MDLLMKSQLTKARGLIQDAEREDEARADEVRSCSLFLDLPRKDVQRYSITRGIARMVETITRGMSQFGARDLYRAPQGAGAHVPMAFSRDLSPGFDGLEGECHRAIEKTRGPMLHQAAFYVPSDVLYKRDLTVASGSGGGFLVASTLGSFIDYLRNVSVVFRLGAQRITGHIGNLVLPKETGAGTSVWLPTEASSITETNETFGQVTGTPKTAAIYTEISRLLLKEISPDIESRVKRGLAEKVALTVDEAALVGTGASGQPLGISGTAGIGGVVGTSLGYAGLVEAQTDIADGNAIVNPLTLAYVTPPLVAQLLKGRQRFTSTDSPLWAGAIHQGLIEGVTALSSRQLPANTMIYGDFSSLLIAEWGSLVVEVDPFTKFTSGIVGVRSLWTVDVLVQHPGAFTLISSIT
jgi:HK97 family phage major capsid protein